MQLKQRRQKTFQSHLAMPLEKLVIASYNTNLGKVINFFSPKSWEVIQFT